MRAWLEEPLLHFLAAGALLFAAHAWLRGAEPDAVSVTSAEVEWLEQSFARQWQRPPAPDELRGLVSAHLDEKLLSREARELGLDEDDAIVRRRLAQKLEFLVTDTAELAEPSDEELARFYRAQPESFQSEARVSFAQVFFSRERRTDADGDARAALERLARGEGGLEPLGDALLLEANLEDAPASQVAARFGQSFADALLSSATGVWTGPIESSYGVHLVQVRARTPAAQRAFEQARPQVLERWREERRRAANAAYLAGLRQKYAVHLDARASALVGAPATPDQPWTEAGR